MDSFATNKGSKTPGSKRTRELKSDEDRETEDTDTKDKKSHTYAASSPKKAFLQASFYLPKPADNTWRSWITTYSLPEGDETRCSKMDVLTKGELPKDVVDADTWLSLAYTTLCLMLLDHLSTFWNNLPRTRKQMQMPLHLPFSKPCDSWVTPVPICLWKDGQRP